MLATQEETIDWEGKRDLLVVQLLGLLACRADGLHDDDEKKIDQLLTRRNLVHCEEQVRYLSAEEQVRYLEFWSSHVLAYPDKDPLLAYFSTLYTGVGDGTGDYSSSFEERFTAAGGAGTHGTRTIQPNWTCTPAGTQTKAAGFDVTCKATDQ